MDDLMNHRHRSLSLPLNQYYMPHLPSGTLYQLEQTADALLTAKIPRHGSWPGPFGTAALPAGNPHTTALVHRAPDGVIPPSEIIHESADFWATPAENMRDAGQSALPFQRPQPTGYDGVLMPQPGLRAPDFFPPQQTYHPYFERDNPMVAPGNPMPYAQLDRNRHVPKPTATIAPVEIDLTNLLLDTPEPVRTTRLLPFNDSRTIDNAEEAFKKMIEDVFPDICEEYLLRLYAKHGGQIRDELSLLDVVQRLLEDILVQPSYPKRTKKRKRTQVEEEVENIEQDQPDESYNVLALKALDNEFPFVQHNTVRNLLARHKTVFKTYQALYQLEEPEATHGQKDPLTRLRRARPRHEIFLFGAVECELRKVKKFVAEKEAAKEEREEVKIDEDNTEKAGTMTECQCCFADVTHDQTISCDGTVMHFFCYQCIKTGAKTQLGLMKYEMKCFDVSGCQAGFDRKLLKLVVGEKIMERLDRLQQMDEIAKAGLEGLEDCPFCDFKAICPPVEQNKEFACQNPECGKISCRLCKEDTHTPRTCEEAKKDRGVPERRAVEEAMTKALIRNCPRCGISIIKEDGCNKIQCKCGTLICDVCKKDITTIGYSHFSPHAGGCPSHENDSGRNRLEGEVKRAEKEAVDKIIAENGNIGRELLHIKLPESKKKPKYRVPHHRQPPQQVYQFHQFIRPQPVQPMPVVQPMFDPNFPVAPIQPGAPMPLIPPDFPPNLPFGPPGPAPMPMPTMMPVPVPAPFAGLQQVPGNQPVPYDFQPHLFFPGYFDVGMGAAMGMGVGTMGMGMGTMGGGPLDYNYPGNHFGEL